MTDPAATLPYRSGVGIVLLDPGGRLFLARRSDQADAWQMPQGGIDPGETPRAAAFRELREETGVTSAEFLAETTDWLRYDLPPAVAGRIWGGRYRGQAQKWLALRFLGQDSEIDLGPPGAEFDRWRWAMPDEALRLIIPFKRPVYKAVFAAFAPYLAAGAR